MIRPLSLLALVVCSLSSWHSAHADSIVHNLPISTGILAGPTDVPIDSGLFSLSVSVPQFDPSLGTLDNVTILYSFDFLLEGTTLTGGALSGGVGGNMLFDGLVFNGAGGGTGGGGPPGTISVPFNVAGDATGSGGFDDSWVLGTGTSTLEYTGSTLGINPSGVVGATLSATGGGFTVTYDFTPVPEPATAVVLGGGLLAAAMFVRRRS